MKKIGTRQYSFTGGGFLGPLKEFASLPLLMVRDGDGKIRVFSTCVRPAAWNSSKSHDVPMESSPAASMVGVTDP